MQLALPTLSQPLKQWEKIELVVEDDSETSYYMSRIKDFRSDGIIISSPEFFRGKSPLKGNDSVMVPLTREGAINRFHSRMAKSKAVGLDMFLLSRHTRVKRLQRRRPVRINATAEVMYVRIQGGQTGDTDSNQLRWHAASSLDLSAGGILIPRGVRELNQNGQLALKTFIVKRQIEMRQKGLL